MSRLRRLLSIANGGVTLENSKVAVATLDPTKALGSSAFGPLIFRTIVNGVAGDWQPLATLVRLPALRELKCPASAELACKLSGSNLFLVQSVSSDADFKHAVEVPDGFPGYSLPVPHPVNDVLYVKLRDDPTVVSRATLAAQQLAPSPQEVAQRRRTTGRRGAPAGRHATVVALASVPVLFRASRGVRSQYFAVRFLTHLASKLRNSRRLQNHQQHTRDTSWLCERRK